MLLLLKSNGPGISLVRSNTATTSSTNATSQTITLPTIVAGHGVVVTTSNWASNGKAVTAVTDNAGGTYVQAATQSTTQGVQAQWYCYAHPGSASTVTVTITYAASTSATAVISEWSQPLVAGANASGSSSVTVTAASSQLALAVSARNDNVAATANLPARDVGRVSSTDSSNGTAYTISTSTSATISWNLADSALAVAYAIAGNAKIWNGSAFIAKPVKIWNGSSWVKKPVKVWTGSAWKITRY